MCKNTTCSQPSKTTYCSQKCKDVAGRVRTNMTALPDLWVSMDTDRAIRADAADRGVSVRALLWELIERKYGDVL